MNHWAIGELLTCEIEVGNIHDTYVVEEGWQGCWLLSKRNLRSLLHFYKAQRQNYMPTDRKETIFDRFTTRRLGDAA